MAGPPTPAATRNGRVTSVGTHPCKRRAHRAAHSQANRPVSPLFLAIRRWTSQTFVARIRSPKRAGGTAAACRCEHRRASSPAPQACPLSISFVRPVCNDDDRCRRRTPAVARAGDVAPPKDPSRFEPAPIPAVGGSSDIGFGGGALFSLTRFSPGSAPYLWHVDGAAFRHRRRHPRRRDLSIPILSRAQDPDLPRLPSSPHRSPLVQPGGQPPMLGVSATRRSTRRGGSTSTRRKVRTPISRR